MFGDIQSAIKKRLLLVLLIIHAGLALGIFALARQSFPYGWDLTSSLFLAAVLCLYGGFALGVALVLIPLVPWLRRADRVESLSARLARELPVLVENLPKLVEVIRSLVGVWNEARSGTPRPSRPAEPLPESKPS